jgi:hypothetical protein
MAALEFARDEKVGIRGALAFSSQRFLSYVTAPLLPILGIGVFWGLCALAGLIGRIPGIGDAIVGATFIVPLVFGLIMALILLGAVAGWPLMYATISTEERSDAFDGFSRPYSYIYGRPWQYLGYTLAALVIGSISVFFVSVMAVLMVYLAGWGVASGMGESASTLFQVSPQLTGGRDLVVTAEELSITPGTALAGIWLHLVATLLMGFVSSYFWTASTIVYFLLRQSDDASDLEEIYVSDEDEQDDLYPLVGVAASDQPVVERPREGDFQNDDVTARTGTLDTPGNEPLADESAQATGGESATPD